MRRVVSGPGFSGHGGQLAKAFVRAYALTVRAADLAEVAGDVRVREDASDEERAKKVAFATFVDPAVGSKHFGVVDFLIPESRLTKDFGLQIKRHKSLVSFPWRTAFGAFS